jgi:hypothetical protein
VKHIPGNGTKDSTPPPQVPMHDFRPSACAAPPIQVHDAPPFGACFQAPRVRSYKRFLLSNRRWGENVLINAHSDPAWPIPCMQLNIGLATARLGEGCTTRNILIRHSKVHHGMVLLSSLLMNSSSAKVRVGAQSTYRGRGEIGECICPLSLSVQHNFVHDG